MDPVTGIAFALGAGSFLFDVFDKSVQAYRLYSTAKGLADVSAHLVAKLLIEERRLVQWGDGVGIKPKAAAQATKDEEASELDGRLRENDALYQTVLRALAGIEATLTDIDNLTAKYGLQVFEEENVSDGTSSNKDGNMPPLLPQRSSHDPSFSTGWPGLSETLKTKQDQSRRIQASTSIRKKFQWAIKDKHGFEMLLDRLCYYNDSLYCLLPKESINTIERDVLASLIDAATSQRLQQYGTVASPSARDIQDNVTTTQYSTIASAAMASLQIADVDHLPPVNVWIDETSVSYDGKDSQLGTISWQGRAPVRVFVEKKTPMSYERYDYDHHARKQTIERVKELALLLKEPHHFGFATMACLGVITDMNDQGFRGEGEIKLVYQLPLAADPLAHPVSLHDLLSLEKYRSDEPPEVDVRFQLVTSLAKALHEMHCTGWLHRNISSSNILFLKTRPGSGIESLDLEKPYMAGFDAARSFTAGRSPGHLRLNFDALIYRHPGYLLYRIWSQFKPRYDNTGDKLFYMPRHDYYSMGLVFLEIGMWRSLDSILLCDVPHSDSLWNFQDPESTLGGKLASLTQDVVFARRNRAKDPGQDTEQECNRRRRILADYVSEGPKLIDEEGLTEFRLNEDYLCTSSIIKSKSWTAWDRAYGPQKLREDAIRICQEKLGSRMGRRYREAVRRCLVTDFGVSPRDSKNLDWLRAFNWRVVQELNRCCA